jgi:hypothetical protein
VEATSQYSHVRLYDSTPTARLRTLQTSALMIGLAILLVGSATSRMDLGRRL